MIRAKDQTVRGTRYAVFMDPDDKRGTKKFVSLKVLERRREFASHALAEWTGYLHADERKAMKELIAGEGPMDTFDMAKTEKRITTMIDRNIPPIFKEEFEGNNGFPVVDMIINLVSHAARGWLKQRERITVERFLHPAESYDIHMFRTYAFDENVINPFVLPDLEIFSRDKFNVDEDRLQQFVSDYKRVLAYLEKSLGWMKPGEKELREYGDGEYLDFLRLPMWHVFYSPDSRAEIIDDYYERALEEVTLQSPSFISRFEIYDTERTEALISEIESYREHIRDLTSANKAKQKLKHAFATSDFRYLDIDLLDETGLERFELAVEAYVERRTNELLEIQPEILFCQRAISDSIFKLPIKYRWEAVSRARLRIVNEFDDEQLLGLVNNRVTFSLLINQNKGKSPARDEFARALEARLEKIADSISISMPLV